MRTLEEEIARINRTGKLFVDVLITGDPPFMDTKKELLIFRIIQECMNNTIKHADATTARIELDYGTDGLCMRIADNGKGFEYANQESRRGSGLLNMQARTKMMNGQFSINSSAAGTLLTFSIPNTE